MTNTLQSNDPALAETLATKALMDIAWGVGLGDGGIGKYHVEFASQVASGLRVLADTDTYYKARFDWINEARRSIGAEEVDMPKGTSLTTQISKARAYAKLGMLERVRPGLIRILSECATDYCEWKYTPLTAGATAMVSLMDDDADATDDDLANACVAAMDASQKSKVKTLEGEIGKLLKAWEKLRDKEFSLEIRKADEVGGRHFVDGVNTALTLMVASVNKVNAQRVLSE